MNRYNDLLIILSGIILSFLFIYAINNGLIFKEEYNEFVKEQDALKRYCTINYSGEYTGIPKIKGDFCYKDGNYYLIKK